MGVGGFALIIFHQGVRFPAGLFFELDFCIEKLFPARFCESTIFIFGLAFYGNTDGTMQRRNDQRKGERATAGFPIQEI